MHLRGRNKKVLECKLNVVETSPSVVNKSHTRCTQKDYAAVKRFPRTTSLQDIPTGLSHVLYVIFRDVPLVIEEMQPNSRLDDDFP